MPDKELQPEPLEATHTRSSEERALMAHAAPFCLWFLLMVLLSGDGAWQYGLRSLATASLLIHFRPWRYYSAPALRHFPMAIVMGAAAFLIWIGPETAWMATHAPAAREWYLRYLVGITSFGALPAPIETTPYAPETCGWTFSIIRLVGSAGVIAVAEEFFWRGLLYRALIDRDFLKVDLGKFDLPRFLIVALIFGLEHQRWAAGIIAGIIYAALMIRTRSIWPAIIAHVTTNLMLGIYVLATGSYQFW